MTRKVALGMCTVAGPLFVNAYITLVYYGLIGCDQPQIQRAETSLRRDSQAIQ